MGNCFTQRESYKSSITINTLWYYLTNNNTRKQVYFINSRNIERYEIKRIENQLLMVDSFKNISYNLDITLITLTDCVLTGKYLDNNIMHKRNFCFKLLDDFAGNKNTYGWRTKVSVVERNQLVEYLGLFWNSSLSWFLIYIIREFLQTFKIIFSIDIKVFDFGHFWNVQKWKVPCSSRKKTSFLNCDHYGKGDFRVFLTLWRKSFSVSCPSARFCFHPFVAKTSNNFESSNTTLKIVSIPPLSWRLCDDTWKWKQMETFRKQIVARRIYRNNLTQNILKVTTTY
jgi:hypothetical protein